MHVGVHFSCLGLLVLFVLIKGSMDYALVHIERLWQIVISGLLPVYTRRRLNPRRTPGITAPINHLSTISPNMHFLLKIILCIL